MTNKSWKTDVSTYSTFEASPAALGLPAALVQRLRAAAGNLSHTVQRYLGVPLWEGGEEVEKGDGMKVRVGGGW